MDDLASPPGLTVLLTAILLTSACSTEREQGEVMKPTVSGDPVLATTRVENDVLIYDHAPGALQKAPQWMLEATPATTIGGKEGDPQFDLTYAQYVVPLSDGRVVTFAPVGNKVIVFDKDGRGARTIGRTGQGPGDWMRFGDPVLLANDSILVLDFANNRLNWVTADGGITRGSRAGIPSLPRPPQPQVPSISGMLAGP